MKIKAMTLGLLSLLSISFTGYAQITSVTCPTIDFLEKNTSFINRNAFQVNVPKIGTMRGEAGHGKNLSSLEGYRRFFSAQIEGSILICNYLANFPATIEVVHWIAQLQGWHIDRKNIFWNGNSICRESIEACNVLRSI